MRISFVLSSLRLSGGVRVVVEYANRLAERGHILYLVTPKNSVDWSALPDLAPNVTIIESGFPLKQTPSFLDNLALTISLSKAIPPCDLIISTHTPTTVPAWLAARLWHRTKLFWLYMDYKEMFEDRPIELFLLKHAAQWHDKVLTISNYCRQENLATSGVNATVVGLGLSNTEIIRSSTNIRPQTKTKTILYLGDTRLRKGLALFLEACQQIYAHNSAIKIIVASKWEVEVKKELPIIFFLKPDQKELANLYQNCDVFVYPSWREGFGLPPLEAMAYGAPVVLTDSGGVREYARHEENCLMVPPRDPQALAEAIKRVLLEPELANRLRENGPSTAAQFTWDKAVERFERELE